MVRCTMHGVRYAGYGICYACKTVIQPLIPHTIPTCSGCERGEKGMGMEDCRSTTDNSVVVLCMVGSCCRPMSVCMGIGKRERDEFDLWV